MKMIKNTVVLTFILLTTFLYAQNGRNIKRLSVEEITDKQLEKISEKIKIDDLQKSLLKIYLLDLNNDRKEIMNSHDNRDVKKEKMHQLDISYLPKFKEILSTEQYKQFLEIRDQIEKEHQQKRGFKGNRNRHRAM